ncbi:hypothetical protein OEV98_16035 [Caldibacillus lycopersici]|uniref:Heme ABC transporter n=1 Tax=Perspicuibacillus lycopersici TaxID=1325689 RepID=A0AAE3IZR8_9BACI|nr:hypothetical protein [Perspicuibacillus lycopersici]MCU9615045.1 hypothetical protein [Perspicuibacillus lycopersici]
MSKIEKNLIIDPDIDEAVEYVEVWEDVVSIKDLVLSLIICSITTLGAYFIAPNEPPKPLFFGLFGAILGFAICSILIKPKRILESAKDGK